MHDASEIYRQGIPTVLIVHHTFEGSAKAYSRILGTPDLPLIVVRQPGHVDPEEERQVALSILDKVAASLTKS